MINPLIRKYNVPVPRYTSYPTVPFWGNEIPSVTKWLDVVKRTFDETNALEGISLYIHLPFCDSLCTYCACNTRITKNHKVEEGYIASLLAEWSLYLDTFKEPPIIRELHLGGGTPTFFSPENLSRLVTGLLKDAEIHMEHDFSFEGHPNSTTYEHLKLLYDLGFRRVSYGIQDLDYKVQRTINRIQPFENVERATREAREIGYTSVNYDLIYGLPFQTSITVTNTIQQLVTLMPDRIAYYSYAHVPWVKPGQRGYDEGDLPGDDAKRNLYDIGKSLLSNLGYVDIGMDHFSLSNDNLYKAYRDEKLHRNFMGYTTSSTSLLIGLGTSAISDARYAYMQNLKGVEEYKERIGTKQLTVFKGYFMTGEDLKVKQLILDIACNGVGYLGFLKGHEQWLRITDELHDMQLEGLLVMNDDKLFVTPIGKTFIRNICKVFDLKLNVFEESTTNIFSKSI